MNLPGVLLIVAVLVATVTAIGGTWGLVALGVVGGTAAVVWLMSAESGSFLVGYMLTFGLFMLGGAAVMGALAGAMLRQRRFALVLLPLLPLAYLAWDEHHTKQARESESQRVHDFVRNNRDLARMTGNPFKFSFGWTQPVGKNRTRHYVVLHATRELHAFVIIDGAAKRGPDIRIECVTTGDPGRRDTRQGECADAVVPLGDTTYARVPLPSPARTVVAAPMLPAAPATAAPATPAAPAARVTPNAPAPPAARLAVPVPPDADVSIVGVYEPASRSARTTGPREPGVVTVHVAADSVPLVLVLSSYEAVSWRVNNQGRPISAVLLSSYQPSTVTGIEAQTSVIGRQHAYKVDTPEYNALKAQLAAYTSNPVRLFQGAYSGSAFTVPAH
jgi:hypothetical protein